MYDIGEMRDVTTTKKEETRVTSVRLPKSLTLSAQGKCRREDISFSQLIRRALRRELEGTR